MTIFALLSLLGCPGEPPTYKGTHLSPDYFPMDGDRSATYVNQDPEITWAMYVQKVLPVEEGPDGEEVVTWEYWVEEGDLLATVKWSAENGDAIKIHGWSEGEGEFTTFDTPVLLTPQDGYMNRGEEVTTETNGYTFTSTFVETVTCPVQWGLDEWECVHLELDDGDGDDTTGPFFAGDWYLVTLYGPAWMRLTGYTADQLWDLAAYDWLEGE